VSVQAVAADAHHARRLHRADASAAFAAMVLAVGALMRFGLNGRGVVAAFVVCVLVVLSRIDLERRILPNRIVLPAAASVFAAQVALYPDRAVEWMLAPLLTALVLLLPSLLTPGALGMGDVKLGLLLGAALGADVATALVLGFLFVFPVALWLVVRGGPEARKRAIPFGPFLAAGAIVALFLA
jgi:leader peptidase (prepilin peptidase) / N-methyltransferase